jgi:coenzyme Q-binding protein COQ10
MYQIVADVEAYPQFLPLCEALKVDSREVAGEKTIIIATMSVGYKTIRESFRTRVTLTPGEPAILVEYLDGPFKRLENRWRFLPTATGSDVHFFIDYEFRSVMLSVLMGALFDKAFRRFSEAFEDRARTVYGPVQPAPV